MAGADSGGARLQQCACLLTPAAASRASSSIDAVADAAGGCKCTGSVSQAGVSTIGMS